MGQPRDHHFIPAFYLRQWQGDSGKLMEFKRVNRTRIVQKLVGAEATGFHRDLYAFPELGPIGLDQHLESRYFQVLDDEAAKSHQLLLAGDYRVRDPRHMIGWSRFLLSLKFRHPDAIAELRVAIPRLWGKHYASSQQKYELIKKPHDPELFEDFVRKRDPNVVEKVTVNLIMRTMENDRMWAKFDAMEWDIFSLSRSKYRLLISDRPAHYDKIGSPEGFVSLPLSPDKLFVGAVNVATLDRIANADPDRLAAEVNKKVVSQARLFAWSTPTAGARGFMEKYFGRGQETFPLFPGLGEPDNHHQSDEA